VRRGSVEVPAKYAATGRRRNFHEIRRQLAALGRLVLERRLLRVGREEEIEGIVDRHLGDQVDLDAQLARLVGKHQTREIVRLRILLPVDEVIGRRHAQRIAQYAGTAMRRRPQPHDLRAQAHETIVAIMGQVIERNMDRHGSSPKTTPIAPTWCDRGAQAGVGVPLPASL
jgi:hypothetical protein